MPEQLTVEWADAEGLSVGEGYTESLSALEPECCMMRETRSVRRVALGLGLGQLDAPEDQPRARDQLPHGS